MQQGHSSYLPNFFCLKSFYIFLSFLPVSQANTGAGSTMQFQDLHLHLRFLKVSQASFGDLASTFQIAESFTIIYRTQLTELKQGMTSRSK
jgi:hypothetical protein